MVCFFLNPELLFFELFQSFFRSIIRCRWKLAFWVFSSERISSNFFLRIPYNSFLPTINDTSAIELLVFLLPEVTFPIFTVSGRRSPRPANPASPLLLESLDLPVLSLYDLHELCYLQSLGLVLSPSFIQLSLLLFRDMLELL